MSTPDQPSQPLTRRRLRELKMTGQTPVITPEDIARAAHPESAPAQETAADQAAVDGAAPAAEATEPAPESASPEADKPFSLPEPTVEYPLLAAQADEPAEPSPAAKAEEAAAFERAAEESTAPAPGTRPLTRREIREQERLRTAQLQVVLPPVEGVPAIPVQGPEERPSEEPESGQSDGAPQEAQLAAIETVVVGENETSVVYEVVEVPFGEEAKAEPDADQADEAAPVQDEVHELVYEDDADEQDRAEDPDGGDTEAAEAAHRADEEFADRAVETVFVVEDAPTGEVRAAEEDAERSMPAFDQRLLAPKAPSDSEPESFEQMLTHPADSSGSAAAGSTLVLASDPSTIPLSAPITATGELIITSSHTLPEGFGSRGHAQGTTDGKEVDVVLLDGELPLASSPAPVSASDAVSTSKSPSEVIRPPAPEKSHRLTLLLGITAGVLGIALIGVVVAAFTTGVLG